MFVDDSGSSAGNQDFPEGPVPAEGGMIDDLGLVLMHWTLLSIRAA